MVGRLRGLGVFVASRGPRRRPGCGDRRADHVPGKFDRAPSRRRQQHDADLGVFGHRGEYRAELGGQNRLAHHGQARGEPRFGGAQRGREIEVSIANLLQRRDQALGRWRHVVIDEQAVPHRPVQARLPTSVVGEGVPVGIDVVTSGPGVDHLGAVDSVTVEQVGDRPGPAGQCDPGGQLGTT